MSTAITTKEQWAPCLLLQGQPTACGISTSYPERLPGLYDTSAQAMAAAGLVPPDTIHADGQLRRGETLMQRYRVTQVTAMKRLTAMPGEEAD